MKVWNITCECGHDEDHRTLKAARKEAKKHLTHNADGVVYIDKVETDGSAGNGSDYQTGISVIVHA